MASESDSQSSNLMGNLAEGNMQFAFKLYKEFGIRGKKENIFFSPLSIVLALAMTRAGAKGKTLTVLNRTLGLDKFKREDEVNSAIFDLLQSLTSDNASFILLMANRIYLQNSYIVHNEFLESIKGAFGGSISGVDFANNPVAASEEINNWVEQQTANKIKNLISSDALDTLTRLVLVNAIYFKGKWVQPFEPRETISGKFYCTENHEVLTSFMNIKDQFSFAANKQLKSKILELPYVGGRLSMIVVLPDEKFDLDEVESKMNTGIFHDLLASLGRPKTVIVSLPKFKLEIGTDMVEILRSVGMKRLFGTKANLRGICSRDDLFVSSVAHKAFVDVNEEGSEAAAATSVAISTRMLVVHPSFTADHPFLFFIYDKITDTILFMGRLSQPTAAPADKEEL